MNLALNGLKVIELGNAVSAPFCSALLADFGAEVIKIESPKGGDMLRGMGNFKDLWFAVENRTKTGSTFSFRVSIRWRTALFALIISFISKTIYLPKAGSIL